MNPSHVLVALVVASAPFVSDAAMAAPYQEYVDIPCSTTCLAKFKPVPPDRRLEITHVACAIFDLGVITKDVIGPILRVTKAADGSTLLEEWLTTQCRPNFATTFVGSAQTSIFVQAR